MKIFFFSYFNKFEAIDPKYAYIANFGNYALRFNICIDNILVLLGHDYLIKSGVYDKYNTSQYIGHPLIINYGPKHSSEYLTKPICLDDSALYAYRINGTSLNPIIIDDFINKSDFIKEIIKRSMSGYIYKDQNSCGCYQAFHRKYAGGVDGTILVYLFNYLSILDNFCHLVDYIYDLNMREVIKNIPNTKANINWGNVNIIIKELGKKGKYAELLVKNIDRCYKRLNSGNMKIAHVRNVVMHEGNILIFSEKNGRKGIFICTENDPDKILRPDMPAVFDALPFVIKSYAILIKLFSEFYGILMNSVKNGETVFKVIKNTI